MASGSSTKGARRMGSYRGAEISDCGKFRYKLWRGDIMTRPLVFMCLNPSTADGTTDDATVRRLNGFTSTYGFSGFTLMNLFAYRATQPKDLLRANDPVGPLNDAKLWATLKTRSTVICAWGTQAGTLGKAMRDRLHQLQDLFQDVECWSIGPTAKDGSPRHPLYLKYELELQPWGLSMLR